MDRFQSDDSSRTSVGRKKRYGKSSSVLELTQNEFPYPRDLAPFELMLHISQSKPPTLEDDPVLSTPWSSAMKDFIALS